MPRTLVRLPPENFGDNPKKIYELGAAGGPSTTGGLFFYSKRLGLGAVRLSMYIALCKAKLYMLVYILVGIMRWNPLSSALNS
jgi:hypothetical protein